MIKILIVKLSSIGDVVHTLPALWALKRGLPGAEVDWIVEEAASEIVTGNPLIEEVIVVKRGGWFTDTSGNMAIARRLHEKRYDLVIDFQGLMKSALWVGATRCERRVGFANARELAPLFYSEKVSPYDPERHAVERYLDLARYVGGAPQPTLPPTGEEYEAIYVGDEKKERVEALLAAAGIGETERYFIVNPSARWATKLWTEDRFAEVILRVEKGAAIRGVIVGAAADMERGRRINEMTGGKAVNLAGETDLKELAHLIGSAEFMVTVDSGPMHIAAAVGTPVVAVFGPTAPWRTGPYGTAHRVIRKELDCSPCFKRRCPIGGAGALKCMTGVVVDEVERAVKELMEAGSGKRGPVAVDCIGGTGGIGGPGVH